MAGSEDSEDHAQEFGGPWSLLKLETVSSYLQKFNTALSKQSFTRVYIDAFAGSGAFTFGEHVPGGFFPDAGRTVHDGSAKRALAVQPCFDELHFIDSNPNNSAALQRLIQGKRGATVWPGDANEVVQNICANTNWRARRGVIFLDPFGTTVEWSTLQKIAATQALDVWYLAPLAGIYRNAPRDLADLTEDKRRTVTRIVGTDAWEDEFYKVAPPQSSLFGEPTSLTMRVLDVDGIEGFMKRQLETIFPHVETPMRLYGQRGAPMFSLFFAVSNPAPAAIKVAVPIARHLLRAR